MISDGAAPLNPFLLSLGNEPKRGVRRMVASPLLHLDFQVVIFRDLNPFLYVGLHKGRESCR
jgi:hypothetical protein